MNDHKDEKFCLSLKLRVKYSFLTNERTTNIKELYDQKNDKVCFAHFSLLKEHICFNCFQTCISLKMGLSVIEQFPGYKKFRLVYYQLTSDILNMDSFMNSSC